MSEIRQLLERQSEWQKRRANISWPEKIRMAEAMRRTILEFQEMRRRLHASIDVATSNEQRTRNP